MLDARHLNTKNYQAPESWPLKRLATQIAGAITKKKPANALLYAYAHATLDKKTIKITGFSTGDQFFASIRGFYGPTGPPNVFTQQIWVGLLWVSKI